MYYHSNSLQLPPGTFLDVCVCATSRCEACHPGCYALCEHVKTCSCTVQHILVDSPRASEAILLKVCWPARCHVEGFSDAQVCHSILPHHSQDHAIASSTHWVCFWLREAE